MCPAVTYIAGTTAGETDAQRRQRLAGQQCRPVPLPRRLAAGGGVPADLAVDPGWRSARRHRLRSLEYHPQHPHAVPAAVGPRLRRGELAVALLSARRRDRDPGLAAVADVRHAARPVDLPSKTGAADAIAICRLRRCAWLRWQ